MNNGRITICPYYVSEKDKSLTCEDTKRLFESKQKKYEWMDQFCDADWQQCKYAQLISEAYEKNVIEEEKTRATREELRRVTSKLNKTEKKLEARDEEVKRLRKVKDKWEQGYLRKAEELRKEEELTKLQAETMAALALQYEIRLAYLIDMYVPDKHVEESDIDTWVKSVEYILDGNKDDTGHVTAWDVTTRKRGPYNVTKN